MEAPVGKEGVLLGFFFVVSGKYSIAEVSMDVFAFMLDAVGMYFLFLADY